MTACSLCGKMHDQPFTKEMLDYHALARESENVDERCESVELLVDQFYGSFDPLDSGWPEEMHTLVDAVAEAEMELDRAKRALGRVLLRSIDAYIADHDEMEEQDDESLPPVSKRPAGKPGLN